MSEKEIVAAFFALPAAIKQHLRLMTVFDSLPGVYGQDGMRLMAFSVSDDYARRGAGEPA
ncbi:hypothetical protein [Komagataeibacter sp. FNDCF1]|uniref:hypothetical protein n=1 Tax=Komagataeibacter sp. FNDCF1 TaxID=2878681 RepID=UPI00351D452D